MCVQLHVYNSPVMGLTKLHQLQYRPAVEHENLPSPTQSDDFPTKTSIIVNFPATFDDTKL